MVAAGLCSSSSRDACLLSAFHNTRACVFALLSVVLISLMCTRAQLEVDLCVSGVLAIVDVRGLVPVNRTHPKPIVQRGRL